LKTGKRRYLLPHIALFSCQDPSCKVWTVKTLRCKTSLDEKKKPLKTETLLLVQELLSPNSLEAAKIFWGITAVYYTVLTVFPGGLLLDTISCGCWVNWMLDLIKYNM